MERDKKGSYLWNPLQVAFDQEFSSYLKYYESDFDVKLGQKKQSSQRAKPELLLNLWKNYGNKVERLYFEEKLLFLGDHMFGLKDFLLGGKYCYHKLLQDCKVDYFFNVGDGRFTAREFEENYFGDLDPKSDAFKNKIRALLGAAASHSHQQLIDDSKLQSSGSVAVVLRMLQIIQLTLQIALKEEKLFWLVYNGTIHMYTICKNLVDFGHSDKALIYALWACVCMESSVPLMTLTYLAWRTQLYVLVSQCYYNCNFGEQGESFARRAVLKVQEIQDIEQESFVPSPNMNEVIRQCKLRLMLMVFKRTVFESRRRPKGILRPKNKPILKDIMQNPWPRTQTERMLTDFFPTRAAQMLAILEALSNPCQRLLHTAVGASDLDDSIIDVYSELFFAATEIIAGGGGTHPPLTGRHETSVGHLVNDVQLVELALQGKDAITVSSFSRFVMLTFNLENFELFETYHATCHTLLTESNTNGTLLVQIKELELCQALFNLHPTKHRKRPYMSVFEEKEVESIRTSSGRVGKHPAQVEELFALAKVVDSCFSEKTLCLPVTGLLNSLIDATLYLWSKVKTHFSRVTAVSVEVAKILDQDGHFEKWLQILVIVQQAMMKSSFTDVDSCCCSEASARLALIYEILYCHGELIINRKGETATSRLVTGSRSKVSKRDEVFPPSKTDLTGSLYDDLVQNPENLLKRAKEVLQNCIESIHTSYESKCVLARKADLLVRQSEERANSREALLEEIQREESRSSNLTVSSLYLELLILMNRIDHRMSAFQQKESASKISLKSSRSTLKMDSKGDNTGNQAFDPKKNFLLQAVKNISALEVNDVDENGKNDDLLQESFALIAKGNKAMKSMIKASKIPNSEGIPPPPNVVYRGPTFIIFEPAPYTPSGEEVKWYRLYVRTAAGNNVKARLSDTHYKGSGKEALNLNGSFLTVTGLEPNERYVAAVAAFDAKDNLVGGAIGQTTKPILACFAVPYLNVLGYLAKVAYERNAFSASQKACQVLFDHFVEDDRDLSSQFGSINRDFKLIKGRLNMKTLNSSSSITLRYFVQTVLLSVDQQIIENALFCDSLSDQGPLRPNQIARIKLCEKLALAIKAGAWLNDNSICIQAVITTYGLLAPMLHYKILCPPTVKVFLNCFSVLQELYPVVKQRKQTSSLDNLQRMLVNIVYYIAKNLEMQRKKKKAISMVEKGMLVVSGDPKSRSDTVSVASDSGAFPHGPEKKQKKTKLGRKSKPSHTKQQKASSDSSPTDPGVLDIKALDAYLRRLSKEVDLTHEDETGDVLSGVEDSSALHAIVSTVPVQFAYKEVIKFKRRTLFLQHFVRVISRALEEGYHDQVAEWTKDVTNWLFKRNDIMLAKAQGNKIGPMLVIGDEEKNKKYSAAVVEYGKKKIVPKSHHLGGESDLEKDAYSGKSDTTLSSGSKAQSRPYSSGKDGNQNKRSAGSTQKQLERIMATKKNALLTDQEREAKEAIIKIQTLLPEYWQTALRRRRLRVVFLEELPWRSQMNYISARSLCDQAMAKLRSVIKSLNLKVDGSDRAMDTTVFYLPSSGMLTISWVGSVSKCQEDSEKIKDRGGKRKEHAKDKVKSVAGTKGEKDNSRALVPGNVAHCQGADGAESKEESRKDFYQMLQTSCMTLRKAVVLAHRSNNYKLAHNACVELFNLANTLLRFAFTLKEGIDPSVHQNPLYFNRVRQLLWRDLYIASDCLLDFLEQSGKQPAHREGERTENSFASLYGSIADCRGGMSVKFDRHLDNNSLVHLQFVKKKVLLAVEFLYYEEKWERLVDLTSRFQIVTGGRYSELILPILIVAQKRLKGRMDAVLHFDVQQSLDSQQIPMHGCKRTTKSALQKAINIGVMIDPFNSNLYNLAQEGHKRSRLAVDTQENYSEFYKALESKQYTARALEHSRKLFFLYVMAKCGDQEVAARLRNWTCSVSFAAEQVNPPSDVPVEYEGDEIISKEEVEYLPIPESCQGTVMRSFQKTVEILLAHQQKGLSAQAMHELGNLLFHGDNIREAYHYWAEALDLLLKKTNCIEHWQELIDKDDETVLTTRGLLKRAGIWGVILGGILAAKIARYVHTSHLGKRAAYCRLAANLFMALLTSSLPHPSMHIRYATYDIGPGHTVQDIIPGIDLFSDYHRADGVLLLSAVIWTCEEYLRNQFYIQVLPLLTIAQYLSTHVCNSVELAVRVKLMRVTALCRLGLFSQAIGHFSDIINHHNLPMLAGQNRPPTSRKPKEMKSFKEGAALLENVEVLHAISNFHPSRFQVETYGTSLCLYLALTHAEIMITLATTIYEVPESYQESVELILPEGSIEERMTPTRQSSSHVSPRLISKKRKSRAANELPMGPSLSQSQLKDFKKYSSSNLKEHLLCKAEELLALAFEGVDIQEARKNRSFCQLMCLQLLLRSAIAHERLLVHTAVRYIFDALQLLSSFRTGEQYAEEEISESNSEVFCRDPFAKLDSNIWLMTRLALAKELRFVEIGSYKSLNQLSGTVDISGSCRLHTEQGLMEADAFDSAEYHCSFLYIHATEDLKFGENVQGVLDKLQVIVVRMSKVAELSDFGFLLQMKAALLKADLSVNVAASEDDIDKVLEQYQWIETSLLKRCELMGVDTEQARRAPVVTLLPSYSVIIPCLVKVKVRLARIRGSKVSPENVTDQGVEELHRAIQDVEVALDLSARCQSIPPQLITELHDTAGLLKFKALLVGEDINYSDILSPFLQSVNIAEKYVMDLGQLRQLYNNISMFAFVALHKHDVKTQIDNARFSIVEPTQTDSKVKSHRPSVQQQKMSGSGSKKEKEEKGREKEREVFVKIAWIAVRAASLIAKAQKKISLLTGEPKVNAEFLPARACGGMPLFLIQDLVGSDRVISNSNDKGCYVQKTGIVSVGDYLDQSREAREIRVSWLAIINLWASQMRTLQYSIIGQEKRHSVQVTRFAPDSDFQRLKFLEIHRFLRDNLEVFEDNCCPILPLEYFVKFIPSVSQSPFKEKLIATEKHTTDLRAVAILEEESSPDGALAGQEKEPHDTETKDVEERTRLIAATTDKTATRRDRTHARDPCKASDFEIAMQWTNPQLDFSWEQTTPGPKKILLFAINAKGTNATTSSYGFANHCRTGKKEGISECISNLHHDLLEILHLAEADLAPVQAQAFKSTGNVQGTTAGPLLGKKKRQGAKAVQMPTDREENIKELLKKALQQIDLLLGRPDQKDKKDIPFPVTVQHVACLESLFNPSYGFITKTTEVFYQWLMNLFGLK